MHYPDMKINTVTISSAKKIHQKMKVEPLEGIEPPAG